MATFQAQTSNKYISLTLTVNETGTDVNSNTSTVSWALSLSKSSSSTAATTYTFSYSATINGGTQSGSEHFSISPGESRTLLSGNTTVTHDSDGSKSISASASISWSAGNGSTGGTLALSTIPRASSLSVSGRTIGSAISLTITAASSAFTHSMTVAYGSYSTTILSYVKSGTHKWTPPMSLCSQTPNATGGHGTLSLYTWSASGAHIGTKNYTFYLDVPGSVVPTLSGLTLEPVSDNSVVSGWGLYVKGYSKVKAAVTAAGSYGSSIQSVTYAIIGLSNAGGDLNYTSPVLTRSGEITVSAYATDSRGRSSGTVSKTITVQDYASPTLSGVSLYRCDAAGKAADTGLYLYALATANLSGVDGKNSGSLTVRYSARGGGSQSNAIPLESGTAKVIGGAILYTQSWEATITLTDSLGNTASTTVTIPTDSVAFHLREGGKGVGLGKYAEQDGIVDSAWDILSDGNMTAAGSISAGGSLSGVGLTLGGTAVADFVTETGTSGNWTYRVWKSGHREAWGYYDAPYINSNVFWGSISLPGSGYRYTFATLTDYGSNASTALKWNVKAYCSSAGNAARVYVHRPDGGGTSGSTMRVYLYAFG